MKGSQRAEGAWANPRKSIGRFVLFILLSLVQACSGDTTQGTGLPDGGGPCSSHDDCPEPLLCQGGVCGDVACLTEAQVCDAADGAPCCRGFECRAGVCQIPRGDPGDDRKQCPELVADKSELAFGAVQLGEFGELELRLRNNGLMPLSITDVELGGAAADNPEIALIDLPTLPVTLETDEELPIVLRYTPRDPGSDSGTLLIASNDCADSLQSFPISTELKGERIAAVVDDLAAAETALTAPGGDVPPFDCLDFGAVPVGETAEAELFLINAGTENNALTVQELRTVPRSSDHFSVSTETSLPHFLPVFAAGSSQDPDDFVVLRVEFRPAFAGDFEESLSISTTDPELPDLRPCIRGEGTVARLLVEPNPIDLGEVFLGDTGRLEVLIRSVGGVTLELTGLAPDGDTGDFRFEGLPEVGGAALPSLTVEAGVPLRFFVLFEPQDVGAQSTLLTVTSNDDRGVQQVPISAEGALPPEFFVEPLRVDFGPVQIGQRAQQILTVGNSGEGVLRVLYAWEGDAGSGTFSFVPAQLPGVVAPGLGLNLFFEPTELGEVTDTLVFESNDPSAPQIRVEVTGAGSSPAICVTPETIAFGTQFLGERAGPESIRVCNCGAGPLSVLGVALSAGSDPDFALSGVPASTRVLTDAECFDVGVTFTPRMGSRSGEVVITHNVADVPEGRVTLSGAGEGCAPCRVDLDGDPNTCEYACPQCPAGDEVCDDIDNDCDGVTDEGFGVGADCEGIGACGAGTVECAAPDRTRCSTESGGTRDQSQDELCDDLDNDCDGSTDETFPLGEPCEGEGQCGPGIVECAGLGGLRCSTEAGGAQDQSSAELCNGLDDDCDGATDEPFGVGMPCTMPGECGEGVFECDGPAGARCSVGPGGSADRSQDEICDGRDNDCDGATDNGFGIGEVCDGLGECGVGIVECAAPDATRCSTEPGGTVDQSVAEICDGRDEDCDGVADDDWDVGLPCDGVGECGAGVWECLTNVDRVCSTDIEGSAYAGFEELCNGLDDDCDGATDEKWASELGVPCGNEGICGPGITECDGGDFTRCSTLPGGSQSPALASDSVCNGLDDDCDGSTDENFGIGSACLGEGECGAGSIECFSDSTAGCSTSQGGSEHPDPGPAEICDDGLDNDCDSFTDLEDDDCGPDECGNDTVGEPSDNNCGSARVVPGGVFSCLGGLPIIGSTTGVIGTDTDEDWIRIPATYQCLGSCAFFGGWQIRVTLSGMTAGQDYHLAAYASDCPPAPAVRYRVSQTAGNASETINWIVTDGSLCSMNLNVRVWIDPTSDAPSCQPYTLSWDIR